LNQESRGDDISYGDAINLSPLQLCKEAAHNIYRPYVTIMSRRVSDREIRIQNRCAFCLTIEEPKDKKTTETMTSERSERLSEPGSPRRPTCGNELAHDATLVVWRR
jgi:hypothetical protein